MRKIKEALRLKHESGFSNNCGVELLPVLRSLPPLGQVTSLMIRGLNHSLTSQSTFRLKICEKQSTFNL